MIKKICTFVTTHIYITIFIWWLIGTSCLMYDWTYQEKRDLTVKNIVDISILGLMGPMGIVFLFDDVIIYKHPKKE